MNEELKHRRASTFIDEYIDKYAVMAISWNGDERIHLTVGRDSLEIIREEIVPSSANSKIAVLANPGVTPYRNDLASLTIPWEIAEDLAISLLKVVEQIKNRTPGNESS